MGMYLNPATAIESVMVSKVICWIIEYQNIIRALTTWTNILNLDQTSQLENPRGKVHLYYFSVENSLWIIECQFFMLTYWSTNQGIPENPSFCEYKRFVFVTSLRYTK